MIIGHYVKDASVPGGLEKYVRLLIREQTNRGDTVYQFTSVAAAGTYYVQVDDGQALHREATSRHVELLHLHQNLDDHLPAGIPALRTVHDNQPTCPSGTRYLLRAERPCDRPYDALGCTWGHVIDHCGSRRPQTIRHNFAAYHRARRTLRDIPLIAVSEYLKRQLVRAGHDERKVHVLYSPGPHADASYTPPPLGGPPRFLFMGRIVPEKGLAWLINALSTCTDKEICLDVAGEGYLRPAMEKLTEELGVQHRVTFHGWLEDEDLRQLLTSARAVVVPSVWHEPAGLVTLEAAAHGRPVIASEVGGIPEYAGRSFAMLVAPNDVARLSACLDELSRDDHLVETMGRAALAEARSRFTIDAFMCGQDRLYASAMGEMMNSMTRSREKDGREDSAPLLSQKQPLTS